MSDLPDWEIQARAAARYDREQYAREQREHRAEDNQRCRICGARLATPGANLCHECFVIGAEAGSNKDLQQPPQEKQNPL